MAIAQVSVALDALEHARDRSKRDNSSFAVVLVGGMFFTLSTFLALHEFGIEYVLPVLSFCVTATIIRAVVVAVSRARYITARKALRDLVDLHVLKRTWVTPGGTTGFALAALKHGEKVELCFESGTICIYSTKTLVKEKLEFDAADDDANREATDSTFAAAVEKLRAYKEACDRTENYAELGLLVLVGGWVGYVLIVKVFASASMSSDTVAKIGLAYCFLYAAVLSVLGILGWQANRKKDVLGRCVDIIVARDLMSMRVATPVGATGRIEKVDKDEYKCGLRFGSGDVVEYSIEALKPASAIA